MPRAVELLAVVLAAMVPVLPGLLGAPGHRSALDAIAGFLAANHISTSLLVLPVETARDAGLLLVGGHVLLAAAAGLTLTDLLASFGLRRAVLAGVLYELSAAAIGVRDWSGLIALIACPAFLMAVERIGAFRFGAWRLAAAISVVATVCPLGPTLSVVGFGACWLELRLRAQAPPDRPMAWRRFALGCLLGALLTWPLQALDLPLQMAGLSLPLAGLLSSLPDLGLAAGLAPDFSATQLLPLLPVVAMASLAANAAFRGGGLRLLLAIAAACGLAGLGAGVANTGPSCLACLVTLAAIGVSDRAWLPVSLARRCGTAFVLLAAGATIMLIRPGPSWLAAVSAISVIATLWLAGGRVPGWIGLAPVCSAAAIAIAVAP